MNKQSIIQKSKRLAFSAVIIVAASVVSVRSWSDTDDSIVPMIDEIFASWNRTDSPGCSVGVIKNGEMIFEKGYGIANMDWGIPNSASTVFYVGSISKQFTAAAIAILSFGRQD